MTNLFRLQDNHRPLRDDIDRLTQDVANYTEQVGAQTLVDVSSKLSVAPRGNFRVICNNKNFAVNAAGAALYNPNTQARRLHKNFDDIQIQNELTETCTCEVPGANITCPCSQGTRVITYINTFQHLNDFDIFRLADANALYTDPYNVHILIIGDVTPKEDTGYLHADGQGAQISCGDEQYGITAGDCKVYVDKPNSLMREGTLIFGPYTLHLIPVMVSGKVVCQRLMARTTIRQESIPRFADYNSRVLAFRSTSITHLGQPKKMIGFMEESCWETLKRSVLPNVGGWTYYVTAVSTALTRNDFRDAYYPLNNTFWTIAVVFFKAKELAFLTNEILLAKLSAEVREVSLHNILMAIKERLFSNFQTWTDRDTDKLMEVLKGVSKTAIYLIFLLLGIFVPGANFLLIPVAYKILSEACPTVIEALKTKVSNWVDTLLYNAVVEDNQIIYTEQAFEMFTTVHIPPYIPETTTGKIFLIARLWLSKTMENDEVEFKDCQGIISLGNQFCTACDKRHGTCDKCPQTACPNHVCFKGHSSTVYKNLELLQFMVPVDSGCYHPRPMIMCNKVTKTKGMAGAALYCNGPYFFIPDYTISRTSTYTINGEQTLHITGDYRRFGNIPLKQLILRSNSLPSMYYAQGYCKTHSLIGPGSNLKSYDYDSRCLDCYNYKNTSLSLVPQSDVYRAINAHRLPIETIVNPKFVSNSQHIRSLRYVRRQGRVVLCNCGRRFYHYMQELPKNTLRVTEVYLSTPVYGNWIHSGIATPGKCVNVLGVLHQVTNTSRCFCSLTTAGPATMLNVLGVCTVQENIQLRFLMSNGGCPSCLGKLQCRHVWSTINFDLVAWNSSGNVGFQLATGEHVTQVFGTTQSRENTHYNNNHLIEGDMDEEATPATIKDGDAESWLCSNNALNKIKHLLGHTEVKQTNPISQFHYFETFDKKVHGLNSVLQDLYRAGGRLNWLSCDHKSELFNYKSVVEEDKEDVKTLLTYLPNIEQSKFTALASIECTNEVDKDDIIKDFEPDIWPESRPWEPNCRVVKHVLKKCKLNIRPSICSLQKGILVPNYSIIDHIMTGDLHHFMLSRHQFNLQAVNKEWYNLCTNVFDIRKNKPDLINPIVYVLFIQGSWHMLTPFDKQEDNDSDKYVLKEVFMRSRSAIPNEFFLDNTFKMDKAKLSAAEESSETPPFWLKKIGKAFVSGSAKYPLKKNIQLLESPIETDEESQDQEFKHPYNVNLDIQDTDVVPGFDLNLLPLGDYILTNINSFGTILNKTLESLDVGLNTNEYCPHCNKNGIYNSIPACGLLEEVNIDISGTIMTYNGTTDCLKVALKYYGIDWHYNVLDSLFTHYFQVLYPSNIFIYNYGSKTKMFKVPAPQRVIHLYYTCEDDIAHIEAIVPKHNDPVVKAPNVEHKEPEIQKPLTGSKVKTIDSTSKVNVASKPANINTSKTETSQTTTTKGMDLEPKTMDALTKLLQYNKYELIKSMDRFTDAEYVATSEFRNAVGIVIYKQDSLQFYTAKRQLDTREFNYCRAFKLSEDGSLSSGVFKYKEPAIFVKDDYKFIGQISSDFPGERCSGSDKYGPCPWFSTESERACLSPECTKFTSKIPRKSQWMQSTKIRLSDYDLTEIILSVNPRVIKDVHCDSNKTNPINEGNKRIREVLKDMTQVKIAARFILGPWGSTKTSSVAALDNSLLVYTHQLKLSNKGSETPHKLIEKLRLGSKVAIDEFLMVPNETLAAIYLITKQPLLLIGDFSQSLLNPKHGTPFPWDKTTIPSDFRANKVFNVIKRDCTKLSAYLTLKNYGVDTWWHKIGNPLPRFKMPAREDIIYTDETELTSAMYQAKTLGKKILFITPKIYQNEKKGNFDDSAEVQYLKSLNLDAQIISSHACQGIQADKETVIVVYIPEFKKKDDLYEARWFVPITRIVADDYSGIYIGRGSDNFKRWYDQLEAPGLLDDGYGWNLTFNESNLNIPSGVSPVVTKDVSAGTFKFSTIANKFKIRDKFLDPTFHEGKLAGFYQKQGHTLLAKRNEVNRTTDLVDDNFESWMSWFDTFLKDNKSTDITVILDWPVSARQHSVTPKNWFACIALLLSKGFSVLTKWTAYGELKDLNMQFTPVIGNLTYPQGNYRPKISAAKDWFYFGGKEVYIYYDNLKQLEPARISEVKVDFPFMNAPMTLRPTDDMKFITLRVAAHDLNDLRMIEGDYGFDGNFHQLSIGAAYSNDTIMTVHSHVDHGAHLSNKDKHLFKTQFYAALYHLVLINRVSNSQFAGHLYYYEGNTKIERRHDVTVVIQCKSVDSTSLDISSRDHFMQFSPPDCAHAQIKTFDIEEALDLSRHIPGIRVNPAQFRQPTLPMLGAYNPGIPIAALGALMFGLNSSNLLVAMRFRNVPTRNSNPKMLLLGLHCFFDYLKRTPNFFSPSNSLELRPLHECTRDLKSNRAKRINKAQWKPITGEENWGAFPKADEIHLDTGAVVPRTVMNPPISLLKRGLPVGKAYTNWKKQEVWPNMFYTGCMRGEEIGKIIHEHAQTMIMDADVKSCDSSALGIISYTITEKIFNMCKSTDSEYFQKFGNWGSLTMDSWRNVRAQGIKLTMFDMNPSGTVLTAAQNSEKQKAVKSMAQEYQKGPFKMIYTSDDFQVFDPDPHDLLIYLHFCKLMNWSIKYSIVPKLLATYNSQSLHATTDPDVPLILAPKILRGVKRFYIRVDTPDYEQQLQRLLKAEELGAANTPILRAIRKHLINKWGISITIPDRWKNKMRLQHKPYAAQIRNMDEQALDSFMLLKYGLDPIVWRKAEQVLERGDMDEQTQNVLQAIVQIDHEPSTKYGEPAGQGYWHGDTRWLLYSGAQYMQKKAYPRGVPVCE